MANRGPGRPRKEPAKAVVKNTSPPCPKDLHPRAKKEWTRIAKLLATNGLITELDWLQFEFGLRAYSSILQEWDGLKKEGAVLTSPKTGSSYLNPRVGMLRAAQKQLNLFCRDFGLTPKARKALRVLTQAAGGDTEDDLESMLD